MAGANSVGIDNGSVFKRDELRTDNPRLRANTLLAGIALSPVGAVDTVTRSVLNPGINVLNAIGADLDEVESIVPEAFGIQDSTMQAARMTGDAVFGLGAAIAAPPTILRSTGPLLSTASRLGLSGKRVSSMSFNQARTDRFVRAMNAKDQEFASTLGGVGLRGVPLADATGLRERATRFLLPANKTELAADTSRGAARRRARSQVVADQAKQFLAGEAVLAAGFNESELFFGESFDLGDVLLGGAFGILPVGIGHLAAGHMSRTSLSRAQIGGDEAFKAFREQQLANGELTTPTTPGAYSQGVDAWFASYDNAVQARYALEAQGELTGEMREAVDNIISVREQTLAEGMAMHARSRPFQLRGEGPADATGPVGSISREQAHLAADAAVEYPRITVGMTGLHGIGQLDTLKSDLMARIQIAREGKKARVATEGRPATAAIAPNPQALNELSDFEVTVIEPRLGNLPVDAMGYNRLAKQGGVNAETRALAAADAAAEADRIVSETPAASGIAAVRTGNVKAISGDAKNAFDPFADVAPGQSAVWYPDDFAPEQRGLIDTLAAEFDLGGSRVVFLDESSKRLSDKFADPRLARLAKASEFPSRNKERVGGSAINFDNKAYSKDAVIRLNQSGRNRNTPLMKMEVIAHEFGHVLEKQLLEGSDMEPAVRAAWDKVKFNRGKPGLTTQDFMDDEFAPAIGRVFTRASERGRQGELGRRSLASDRSTQSLNTYEEWVANQVSRYIFDDTPANNVVDKFFKSIAKMWRRIGEKLGARPEYVNGDVRKWLDSIRTRGSVPNLRPAQKRAMQMRDVDALPFAAATRQTDYLDTNGIAVIKSNDGIRLKDHKSFRMQPDGKVRLGARPVTHNTVLDVEQSTAYQALLEGMTADAKLTIPEAALKVTNTDHFLKLAWLANGLEDGTFTAQQVGGATSQQLKRRVADLQVEALRKLAETGQINDYLPSDLSKATGMKLYTRDNEYSVGAEALLLMAEDMKPGTKLSDIGDLDAIADEAARIGNELGYTGEALNTIRTQVRELVTSTPVMQTQKRTDRRGVVGAQPKPVVMTSRYAQRPPTELAQQIDSLTQLATAHRKELLGGEKSHWLIRSTVNLLRSNEVAYKNLQDVQSLHHESLSGQSRITTREFAARDSSVLQAAHILATESDRATNKAIEAVMDNVVQLTSKARQKGNEGTLAQHSVYTKAFRSGLTPKSELINPGLVPIDATDVGNRAAIERLFARSNPSRGAELLSGREELHLFDPVAAMKDGVYKPIKFDQDAADLVNALAGLQYDVLAAHNVARLAVNKTGVVQRNGHVPPENFADKKLAFFRSRDNPTAKVVGFTAADTQGELDNAVRRALQNDSDLVRADELSIQRYFEHYDEIYQDNLTDFRNPLAQTGSTKNVNLDDGIDVSGALLTGQLESIRDGYRRAVTAARKLEFERTINFAKFSHAQSGFKDAPIAGGAAEQFSAQQELMRILEGRSDIAPGSIIGKVNETLTQGADTAFAYAAEKLGMGPSGLSRSQKQVAETLWANGASAQFFTSMDDAFTRARVTAPWQGAQLGRKQQRLNKAAATALLRFGQVGHALLNLTSLMVTAPAVARKLARSGDEDVRQWKERIGPIADYLDDDLASVNPTKLMAEGIHAMFSPDPALKAAYEAAGQRGFFDAKVLEELQKVQYDKPPSQWGAAFDQMIETGSILSDSSEVLSRRLAWGMGYALSKRLNKLDALNEQDHYAFSHWFANQTIGNYDPKQRPDVFRGVSGVSAGLFQTFALNYMQRLISMIETKDHKNLAVQGILQGGMFGLASMPGYETLAGLIGNQHADQPNVTDRIYDTYGKEGADIIWMGGLSNLIKIFPGEQEGIAFYSRGAISPPQFPSALSELAVASLAADTYEGVSKGVKELMDTGTITRQRMAELVAAYAPVRGMRSLAELSIGQSVNRNGDLLDGDNYSFSGFAAAALGSRTADVARINHALWKNYGYSRKHNQRIKRLSDAYVGWHRSKNGRVPKEVEEFFRNEFMELSTERGVARIMKNARDKARRPVAERRADKHKNDIDPLRLHRVTERAFDPAFDDVEFED